MKFIANPDKFVFSIGVGIVGFLFIFSYMVLNQLFILIPLLILWVGFSLFLLKRNYIVYIIQDEKIIIKSYKTNFEIKFNEIMRIVELTNYTNPLKEKRYLLILNENINIQERFLKVENKTFTKWVSKNKKKFKIIKKNCLWLIILCFLERVWGEILFYNISPIVLM